MTALKDAVTMADFAERVAKAARAVGVTVTESDPTERAITIDRLGAKVYEWTEAEEGRPYLVTFYVDDGLLYGLFNQRGQLLRAPLDIDAADVLTVGPLTPVTEQFTPVGRSAFRVMRQADGRMRFFMVAGTAVLNRVGEIDSTELYDDMIARAEATGYYPRLDFYHLGDTDPWFEFGQFDFLMRRGVAYIGSGLLDEDHPLARAFVRAIERMPSYWGASIEYYPALEDGVEYQQFGKLEVLVAKRGLNTRISALPESDAASWFTSVATMRRTMSKIDKNKLAAFRSLFGDEPELFDQMIGDVDNTNETVARLKLVFRDGTTPPAAEAPSTEAPAAEAPPVATGDIELDDAAIEAITRTAVAQFDAKLDPIATALTSISGMVERMAGQLGGMAERLQALEADDATKRDQWRQDLPAKVATRTITHRPREQRGEDTPATSAEVAKKTLDSLPKVNFTR